MNKNTNKTRKKGESHATRAEAAGKDSISPFHATIMYIMGASFEGGPGQQDQRGRGGVYNPAKEKQKRTPLSTPTRTYIPE